jgi:hypothetical protein
VADARLHDGAVAVPADLNDGDVATANGEDGVVVLGGPGHDGQTCEGAAELGLAEDPLALVSDAELPVLVAVERSAALRHESGLGKRAHLWGGSGVSSSTERARPFVNARGLARVPGQRARDPFDDEGAAGRVRHAPRADGRRRRAREAATAVLGGEDGLRRPEHHGMTCRRDREIEGVDPAQVHPLVAPPPGPTAGGDPSP